MRVFHSRDMDRSQVITETKMKNAFVLGGIFALATILGSTATLARSGGGGMHLSGSAYAQPDSLMIVDDGATSLARADKQNRNVVRTRGANKPDSCPPGQKKKSGLGNC